MSDNSSDIGSFIAGFLIGGLVGAAVALLLAPQSGEDTRTFIKTKSIELKDQTAAQAADVRAKADAYAADLRSKADQYARSRGWKPEVELGAEVNGEVQSPAVT
jgi:gas vesicle protein